MFPGVAQVHVVADGEHYAALSIVDAAPARFGTVVFVSTPAVKELFARHLEAVVEIVDGVKDAILVVQVDDLAVGKDAADTGGEIAPFLGAVKIVNHHEAAAI